MDFHPLRTFTAIAQHYCHAARMLVIAQTRPADRVGMIKVIVLVAVRIGLTRLKQLIKNLFVAV